MTSDLAGLCCFPRDGSAPAIATATGVATGTEGIRTTVACGTVYSIDPGTTQSGFVIWKNGAIVDAGCKPNEDVLADLTSLFATVVTDESCLPANVLIEKIEGMGMAVGQSTFETVYWSGRFHQAALGWACTVTRITRRSVKLHLCGSSRAKDANIRQAVMERYGGTRQAAYGTKKAPGPLAGVTGHAMAAMAVLQTWLENQGLT